MTGSACDPLGRAQLQVLAAEIELPEFPPPDKNQVGAPCAGRMQTQSTRGMPKSWQKAGMDPQHPAARAPASPEQSWLSSKKQTPLAPVTAQPGPGLRARSVPLHWIWPPATQRAFADTSGDANKKSQQNQTPLPSCTPAVCFYGTRLLQLVTLSTGTEGAMQSVWCWGQQGGQQR